jgi:hypothetical protein
MQRQELEGLSREELIVRAERLGIQRPRVLTAPELIDEIIRRTVTGDQQAKARGWLGRARDLLARVVERGLHLPDAAKAIRSSPAASSCAERTQGSGAASTTSRSRQSRPASAAARRSASGRSVAALPYTGTTTPTLTLPPRCGPGPRPGRRSAPS